METTCYSLKSVLLNLLSCHLNPPSVAFASANHWEGPSASPHHPALWCSGEPGPTSDEQWFNKLACPLPDWLSLCETTLYFLQFISRPSACDNTSVSSEKREFCAFNSGDEGRMMHRHFKARWSSGENKTQWRRKKFTAGWLCQTTQWGFKTTLVTKYSKSDLAIGIC